MNDKHIEGYEPDYGYRRVSMRQEGRKAPIRIWAKCVRRTPDTVIFIKVDENGEPFTKYDEATNVETETKHLFVCKPEHIISEREARVSLKYALLEVVG